MKSFNHEGETLKMFTTVGNHSNCVCSCVILDDPRSWFISLMDFFESRTGVGTPYGSCTPDGR